MDTLGLFDSEFFRELVDSLLDTLDDEINVLEPEIFEFDSVREFINRLLDNLFEGESVSIRNPLYRLTRALSTEMVRERGIESRIERNVPQTQGPITKTTSKLIKFFKFLIPG